MGTKKKITKLLNDSKAATRKEKILSVIVVVLMVYAVVVSLQWKQAVAGTARLDGLLREARSESEGLRAEGDSQQAGVAAEAERQKMVRFFSRDLRIEDAELTGNAVTGRLQNYGTMQFGDIGLVVLVRASGDMYEKRVTIKSTDGRPLGRWQRRPFTIALDIDPGEGAQWTVYVEDVEVVR